MNKENISEVAAALHKKMKFSIKDFFSKCDQVLVLEIYNFTKKKTPIHVFFCKFCEIFENTFSGRPLLSFDQGLCLGSSSFEKSLLEILCWCHCFFSIQYLDVTQRVFFLCKAKVKDMISECDVENNFFDLLFSLVLKIATSKEAKRVYINNENSEKVLC